MKRLILALSIIGAVTFVLAGTLAADEAPEVTQVVIVDFETDDVGESVMDAFYGELRRAIEAEASKAVAETGDISIGDLLLMTGCESPTPDCLVMARDFVDGDQLLHGSVAQSGETYTFNLELFDFAGEEIVRTVSDASLRGDKEWIDEGISAVVEHLLFGETASLAVTVEDQPEAQIRVNGESVGTGSATIDAIAPGQVVVLAMDPGGQEQQERRILRHQEDAEISLRFGPEEVADIDDPDTDVGPSLIPGLAATGAGLASTVFGFIAQSQLSSARDEATELVGDRGYLESESDASTAQELQNDMNSANTMRFVGWTGGVVGLGAGGFLLFRALTADPVGDDQDAMSSQRSFDVDIGATSEGVNAGVRFDF